MSSFTRLPHSLPTKVLRTLTAHSGSVRCLPTRALSTTSPAGSAPAPAQLAPLVPPFTLDTATRKVKMAQDAWNSRDPQRVSLVYTPDSVWRNRDQFFAGREAIVEFLTDKWAKEKGYRLRKQLHSFGGNKIAVNFWYESFSDELGTWRRTYGLEHWDFDQAGLMYKRHCSANDISITEEERWFKDGADVDALEIDPRDG